MTRSMSITLNPLTDGFVENDKDMVRADGHALIIATDGAFRLTDMMEAKHIIKVLGREVVQSSWETMTLSFCSMTIRRLIWQKADSLLAACL